MKDSDLNANGLSPIELTLNLHQQFKRDSIHHLNSFNDTLTPLIITGYQGLPLIEVAKFLAKTKVCSPPCLTCVSCQSIDKESSIHLRIVRPEGKAIKVDQVRDVLDFLSFKRDQVTTIVFDQAHLMNGQAANALLKTLEEPPENCWLILTSPSIKSVLSTIRSRCLVYKARPVDFTQILNQTSKSNSPIEVLQGRWDWLLKAEEVLSSYKEVEIWLHELPGTNELELLEWMKGKEGLLELIAFIRKILKSEASKFLSAGNDFSNQVSSEPPGLTTRASEVGHKEKWILLTDRLQMLESALQSNVEVKLIEEQLLTTLKENYAFH